MPEILGFFFLVLWVKGSHDILITQSSWGHLTTAEFGHTCLAQAVRSRLVPCPGSPLSSPMLTVALGGYIRWLTESIWLMNLWKVRSTWATRFLSQPVIEILARGCQPPLVLLTHLWALSDWTEAGLAERNFHVTAYVWLTCRNSSLCQFPSGCSWQVG